MTYTVEELQAKQTSLTTQLSQWKQKAAIVEADEARLKAEIAETLGHLKAEFGCDTLTEASALKDKLMEEASAQLDSLEEALNALGRA